MDILEVDVPDKEVESLDDDVTQEWPAGGMPCPVPGCPNSEHQFEKLTNYTKHFKRFHHRKDVIYSCPKCHYKVGRKPDIIRHCGRVHRYRTTADKIHGDLVDNEKFVDPGEFRLPRRRIHHEERERARQQRLNSLPTLPLFELPDNYITLGTTAFLMVDIPINNCSPQNCLM
jgi:hypothetical protein